MPEQPHGDVICADCDWRNEVSAPTAESVQQLLAASLAEHRRLAHNDGTVSDG